MQILRRYQLDIIFLFLFLFSVTWAAFYGIKFLETDAHKFEWLVSGPILLLYFVFLIKMRQRIRLSERRALTGKTLFYWIVLGITLFVAYSSPVSPREYLSLHLFFIIFTLFLADSYWDFKAITLRTLFGKR